MALADHGGVLRGVHAGEVKHGHVGLTVVVDGKVERRKLLIGGEVRGLARVRLQRNLVDVVPGEEQPRVRKVLRGDGVLRTHLWTRLWTPGLHLGTHLNDDTFLQKVLLLGRHHTVVGVVFVVHDVLQVDS